jgi:hypothetical protein
VVHCTVLYTVPYCSLYTANINGTIKRSDPLSYSSNPVHTETHIGVNKCPVSESPLFFKNVVWPLDDAIQNERVERWIVAVNSWLGRGRVPPEERLLCALSLFSTSGSASVWIGHKEDELEYAGKMMTWDWLQCQLMEHYGSPSGKLAMATEWQTLRMGVKSTDGTVTGGKSTATVAAYTALFIQYMRALTAHNVNTSDILVIDRYVDGIKLGYEELYTVMLGEQKVLWFDSLTEAIDAAEIAEVTIKVSRMRHLSPADETLRNTEEGISEEEERMSEEGVGDEEVEADSEPPSPAPPSDARIYGLIYRGSGSEEWIRPLTEEEVRELESVAGGSFQQ